MEPRLTEIDPNVVLQFLGYKGWGRTPEVEADIARCGKVILETARPRAVWRQFALLPEGGLDGTDFRPEGRDIQKLLRDCHGVILMAATLGAEIENLLRRTQISNMADAVILDCCASAAIENVCDNLCADLENTVDGFLTDRFSPGYGDFPFSQQPDFCRVLDLPRRIGVTLSPGGLMIPQKSVTALMGIGDRPQEKRFRGCAYCRMFDHCELRKEGLSCGKQ